MRYPDPGLDLDDLFLFEAKRRVMKDRTVSLHGIRLRGAGGRGLRRPLERDPARVLDDVLDGFISAETAERNYGVVVVAGSHVDAVATESARAARRTPAP